MTTHNCNMRKLALVAAALTATATLALSTGTAMAHPGKLAVLSALKTQVKLHSKSGVRVRTVWQLENLRETKILGSETTVCNPKGITCQDRFNLSQGSIRLTEYYVPRGRRYVLSRMLITGGSGQYSGATGTASEEALAPDLRPSPLASGGLLEVVFDFA